MANSKWIKLAPPPAPPAPYDGEKYQVICTNDTIGIAYYLASKWKWANLSHGEVLSDIMAWKPIEPEPYVESE